MNINKSLFCHLKQKRECMEVLWTLLKDNGILYIVKREKGITIIELLVVIVIMIILMGVVAIPILSQGKNRLIGTCNKLRFDIRYAQQLAISTQKNSGVYFNVTENSYYVYTNGILNYATDPYTKRNLTVDFDTEPDYKGISLVNTNFGNWVSFDYLGAPSYDSYPLGGRGNITLQWGAVNKTVIIEPNTGEVKIQ